MTGTGTDSETATPPLVYQTRLELKGRIENNPYQLHRALWTCFPGHSTASRPFLYHATWGHAPLRVFMQSVLPPVAPTWKEATLLEAAAAHIQFQQGGRYRFVMTGNPTKRDPLSGKRVPILDREGQLEWLRKKFAGAGTLLEADILSEDTIYFSKSSHQGNHHLATYRAGIEVDDPRRMADLVVHGVGSAKSFGCGLPIFA